MSDYNHLKLEKKWQAVWDKKKVYKTKNKGKKCYVLDMFPYPSGTGLHVGHPKGYIGSDVYARFKRMQGFNVLHPMGYDAFGLPAEQYALEHKIAPRKAVMDNIKMFEKQLKIIGLSYDWERKVNTTDPEFFRWTQSIFLKLFGSWYNKEKDRAESIETLIKIFEKEGNPKVKAATTEKSIFTNTEWKQKSSKEKQDILMNYRLAYEGFSSVNWCPILGTVLANDEIIDTPNGPVSERGNYPVEKKEMRQWFLRITAYADRLLSGLESLEWSPNIKEVQKNWIGKSDGLIFSAKLKDSDIVIETFSAHFEACFADTFFVIAPDHPLLPKILENRSNRDHILNDAQAIVKKRDSMKEGEYKEIEGVFTGCYVVDPLGNGNLPLWIAGFALKEYGTGIVKCSAHDERDFAFAKKFNIPLKTVLMPLDQELGEKVKKLEICFSDMESGVLTEPKEFMGRNGKDARKDMIKFLVNKGFARVHSTYKIRDAVFARQRYWGEPIPLRHTKDGLVIPLSEKELPLKLPEVKSYMPTGTGESPLAGVPAWTKKGLETNTMPGWAGSSWYFLRYMDPKNKKAFADKKTLKYWKNVDMYVGGAEHATGHLLYARFWHKFLKDLGLVFSDEPFKALRNQGMILGPDNRKMSKRWGNVINPNDIVETYGADTLRVYEMFMGPFEASLPWNTDSIIGSRRFLDRIWRIVEKVDKKNARSDSEFEIILHKTIKKVGDDIETFSFNTAVSSMMVLLNKMEEVLSSSKNISRKDFEIFLKIICPFAPHMAEEIWQILGNKKLLVLEKWPKFNSKKLVSDEVKIIIQINGKVRAFCNVGFGAKEEYVTELARSLGDVEKWIVGKDIKKVIFVPNKLVNFVI